MATTTMIQRQSESAHRWHTKCFAKHDDERNTGKRIQGSGIRITIDNLEMETAQQRAYERKESEKS